MGVVVVCKDEVEAAARAGTYYKWRVLARGQERENRNDLFYSNLSEFAIPV